MVASKRRRARGARSGDRFAPEKCTPAGAWQLRNEWGAHPLECKHPAQVFAARQLVGKRVQVRLMNGGHHPSLVGSWVVVGDCAVLDHPRQPFAELLPVGIR